MDASESELAAVPLNTKNTSQFVSNRSRIRLVALAVQASSPYPTAWPWLASVNAAQASGQMPA